MVRRPAPAIERTVAATAAAGGRGGARRRATRGAAAAAASVGLEHDPYDEAALAVAHAGARGGSVDRRRRWRPTPRCGPGWSRTSACRRRRRPRRCTSRCSVRSPQSAPAATPTPLRGRVGSARASCAARAGRVRRRRGPARRGGSGAARRGAGRARGGGLGRVLPARLPERRCGGPRRAPRATSEDERRASCLALAGRVLHSSGDLAGRRGATLEAATEHGRRASAQRGGGVAQRPAHAPGPARRGARPGRSGRHRCRGAAAPVRHPARAVPARAYALGQQGRLAELVQAVDRWQSVQDELGEGSARYRAPVANMRSWALAVAGDRDAARSTASGPASTAPRSASLAPTPPSTSSS